MNKKQKLKIDIILNNESQIYNQFNSNQLCDELSNYIYNQCKGIPTSKNIILNIKHNFKMTNEGKNKLVDCIRESFGIDIRENLLKLKIEHYKEMFFILLGTLFLVIANGFNYIHTPIIGEIISIFGGVSIWEMVYNIFFVETQIRLENKRLKKLTEAKIEFIEV